MKKKQGQLFPTTRELPRVKKGNVRYERRLKELFGMTIRRQRRDLNWYREGMYLRTFDGVYVFQYRLREYLVCKSVFKNEEVWLTQGVVLLAERDMIDVLLPSDRLLIRNPAGIYRQVIVLKRFAEYGRTKLLVEDEGVKYIVENDRIERLLETGGDIGCVID